MQRGSSYLARVSQLHIEPASLTALVQGSAPEPYHVDIRFRGSGRPQMSCSCPVGYSCKHVAAVLIKALQGRNEQAAVNPAVLLWIDEWQRAQQALPRKTAVRREALFYVLEAATAGRRASVVFLKGRPGADGHPGGRTDRWENVERALLQAPSFVSDEDLEALRLIWVQRPRNYGWGPIALSGKGMGPIMRALLATGRVYSDSGHGLLPLHEGGARPAELVWQALDEYWTSPRLRLDDEQCQVIAGDEPWYVDRAGGLLGPVDCEVPAPLLARLFELPPLSELDRAVLGPVFAELAPELPSPVAARGLRVVHCAPQPMLELCTVHVWSQQRHRQYDYGFERDYDLALVRFQYEDLLFDAQDSHECVTLDQGVTVRVQRDFAREQQWLTSLEAYGLQKLRPDCLQGRAGSPLPAGWGLESEAAWPAFMQQALPALRAAGWQVQIPADFRHHLLQVQAWHAEVHDEGNGWFGLDLGIDVEGQRVPLAPVLSELFARDKRWLQAEALAAIAETDLIDLPLATGGRVRVEAGRIKPLARTLLDLFDSPVDGRLRVRALDAARLQLLDDPARWQFRGAEGVQAMVERLRAAGQVQPVPVPPGLGLQLRPYQQEGLAWLQYLRAQQLGGILADDMGLGKTAQTLAHLLTEKHAGRLDLPALVVLPTSLVFNWQREAAHIAPDLRLLALHGKERAEDFSRLAEFDVVLTTYPLLWRDEAVLQAQPWHMLIVDEAQTIKNAASRAAASLRRLQARHRLCLTGTPLENHLGELWALFDFLMPGFLGDSRSFVRQWRNPIEKQGDLLRRSILAQRLRPFILRRRKEDVARELPAKTTVIRPVQLRGAQRDLYETVRATVDDAVRQMIAAQGFRRSQIQILDALLKLRQVCCHPRLLAQAQASGELPAAAAAAVEDSAKLELLLDMLPSLLSEGRRVLIFSQFTRMLDLIAEHLQRLHLHWARLDGQTHDRELQVARFQSGEVPIFLLSLKAGGVGLNLTAADTVIHFDPWWNPAAEQQASDRAHRIGQDKPVFIYKLVVAGSIEERIVALQERKAELAAGILGHDATVATKFASEDVLALLAPLE